MKLLIILSVIFITLACTSTPDLFLKKANPALQQKVKEAENENSNDKFSFFFKVNDELSEEQKKQVENLGIKLFSFKGKILSASANSDSIKKLADFEFVETIELSGKSYPVN